MLYTPMTKIAMKLMFEKHKDQVDKSGIPYVFHPWHVAESMPDEDTTIVALLHGIVEDTDVTISDLQEMEFSQDVTDALNLMTHEDGMDYFEIVSGSRSRILIMDIS